MPPFRPLSPAQQGVVRRLYVTPTADLRPHPAAPADREVLVWSPPHDDGSSLPAVLVLNGFAGLHDDALCRSLTEPSLVDRAAALVASGRCPPFRLVMPDCMTWWGGAQFIDSPVTGAWQRYLLDDVLPAVERALPTTRWGTTGRSSGGYGSFQLALARDARVVAVAMHAPDCAFDLCYLEDIPKALRAIQAAGGVEAFASALWTRPRIDGDTFAALNICAMSMAYAEADRPLSDLLPFDAITGEPRWAILEAWRRYDPIRQAEVDVHRAALRGLRLLYLDVGDRDEYMLHLGARRLRDALVRGGVPLVYEEFSGGHRGTAWRYEHSLPLVVQALYLP